MEGAAAAAGELNTRKHDMNAKLTLSASLVDARRGRRRAGATPAGSAVPVTVDNFIRAEIDLYFGGIVKDSGGLGKFITAANRRRSTTRP